MKRLARNLTVLAAFILLAARAEAGAQMVPSVVNVNTATLTELQYLPGIGSAMAARIVAGRPYAHVDDLAKVKGLGGAKRLAALRPYLVTSGPTTLHAKIHAPKKSATIAPDAYRDLAGYSPVAQASIRRGLADGSCHFEPSQYGGEYIWSDVWQ